MRLFVTGIGTEVGKTIIAAILTEALEADYWKPIQAGDLHHSDTDKVKALVTTTVRFYKEAFCLQQPMSPHAAAKKMELMFIYPIFELQKRIITLLLKAQAD